MNNLYIITGIVRGQITRKILLECCKNQSQTLCVKKKGNEAETICSCRVLLFIRSIIYLGSRKGEHIASSQKARCVLLSSVSFLLQYVTTLIRVKWPLSSIYFPCLLLRISSTTHSLLVVCVCIHKMSRMGTKAQYL